MSAGFTHRLAGEADLPAIRALIARSVVELQRPFLSDAQLAASQELMGLDTTLIADGGYFLIEEHGVLAGCGGWSARATPFGGDHSPGRDDRFLDPASEAARIRAMYTDPAHARRGIGRLLLALGEEAARAKSFARVELTATLAGLPLYRASGYRVLEELSVRASNGVAVPLIRMGKSIS